MGSLLYSAELELSEFDEHRQGWSYREDGYKHQFQSLPDSLWLLLNPDLLRNASPRAPAAPNIITAFSTVKTLYYLTPVVLLFS